MGVLRKNKEIMIIIGIGIIMLVFTIKLSPVQDDWHYITSPYNGRESSLEIRRFFDSLFSILVNRYNWLFPWLNHLITIITHTLNAVFFYLISKEIIKGKGFLPLFFSIIFTIGAGTYATICFTDCFNNTLCLSFGLVGLWLYLKKNNLVSEIPYIAFSLLACLTKESGAAFFVIIPLFRILKVLQEGLEEKIMSKTLLFSVIKSYALALPFAVIWLILTFGYDQAGGLGININIQLMVKNLILGQAFSYSAFDTIAFFVNRNLALFIFTGILSAMYLIVTAVIIIRNRSRTRMLLVILLILIGMIVNIPYSVVGGIGAGAQISEYHLYIVCFFALLTLCAVFCYSDKKTIAIGIVPLLLANTISVTHKQIESYKYSEGARELLIAYKEDIQSNIINPTIYVYLVNFDFDDSYGTFSGRPNQSINTGDAFRSVHNWQANISKFLISNLGEKTDNFEKRSVDATEMYDVPFSELVEIAKQRAQNSISKEECDIAVVLTPDGELYVFEG